MIISKVFLFGLCLCFCQGATTGKSSSITVQSLPKPVIQIHKTGNNSDHLSENEIQDSNPTIKPFVSLTAECENETIRLNLHTSEPFHGWFYSRDHQVVYFVSNLKCL